VSVVRAASIIRALIMEAAPTSETSVDNYFTWQYIPEDKSELHTRRRENLKSHTISWWFPRHRAPEYLETVEVFRGFLRRLIATGLQTSPQIGIQSDSSNMPNFKGPVLKQSDYTVACFSRVAIQAAAGLSLTRNLVFQ
jgi:hypothetical protein